MGIINAAPLDPPTQNEPVLTAGTDTPKDISVPSAMNKTYLIIAIVISGILLLAVAIYFLYLICMKRDPKTDNQTIPVVNSSKSNRMVERKKSLFERRVISNSDGKQLERPANIETDYEVICERFSSLQEYTSLSDVALEDMSNCSVNK